MKRVSFKVAKAIKEIGYPQGVLPQIHKAKSFPMYYNGGFVPDYDYFYANYITTFDPNLCVACPTYVDVWFWLWRYKDIKIDLDEYAQASNIFIKGNAQRGFHFYDPEEAIIAAIEYLADNDLIK